MVIDDIGSTDDTALLCHTNDPPPPGGANSGGDWFAPDRTRVSHNDDPGVTRNRGPMVVRLQRTSGEPPEGIYRCSISDATSYYRNLYVGVYNNRRGDQDCFILHRLLYCHRSCFTVWWYDLYSDL